MTRPKRAGSVGLSYLNTIGRARQGVVAVDYKKKQSGTQGLPRRRSPRPRAACNLDSRWDRSRTGSPLRPGKREVEDE